MPLQRRLRFSSRLLFVVAIFVGHVPIGQNDDSRSESLTLSSFFRISDFEVSIVAIFEFFTEVVLEPVGPLGVFFNNFFEVVEELAVGIDASDLNVRASMADEITLKKWDGLESLQTRNKLLKRSVQFEDLLEEQEFHRPSPPVREGTDTLPPRARHWRRPDRRPPNLRGEVVEQAPTGDVGPRSSCTLDGNWITSVAAIVAPHTCTLVRDALGVPTPSTSRLITYSCAFF